MANSDDMRIGAIGHDNGLNTSQKFCDNSIRTSRYRWHNFVILNLGEQFRRVANIYFLVMSIITAVGWYAPRLFQSPYNPFGTLLTLIVVMGITMIKDGFEDRARRLADKKSNTNAVRVLRHGKQVVIEQKDIAVGDYVLVQNKESFPADLVLIASSDPRAQCFVETSNIDGETNLKLRRVGHELLDLRVNSVESLPQQGLFECDLPNKDIHNFNGLLKIGGNEIPLGVGNFLLRGSVLRNTAWIVGLVVYTGKETKIMKNQGKVMSKLSNVEKTVNKLIAIVFLTQFVLVIISVALNEVYASEVDSYYYLGNSTEFLLPVWLGNVFTFYILYSNFVPISLYVSIEMVNVIQAYFINVDVDMYDEATESPAICRNSTLCQELGQVEYIFSDKTGTLTENIMEFKSASIDGKVYDLDGCKSAVASKNEKVVELFRLLSVCHTVVPDHDAEFIQLGGKECPVYEAESPDEGALVEAAATVGIRFWERSQEEALIKEFDEDIEHEYRILAVNEFNSTRKRMSILVQDPKTQQYVLYAKGADNVMFERCVSGDMDKTVNSHLTEMAEHGLRTLLCCKRTLSVNQALEWVEKYNKAKLDVTNRVVRLAEVAEEIENEMEIVGVTAIEDKLQDQVPETLVAMQKAGIKVFVLTGDKMETAVNIGYSCELLNQSMRVVTIAEKTKEKTEEQFRRICNVLEISEDFQLLKKFKAGMKDIKRKASFTATKTSLSNTDDETQVAESATKMAANIVESNRSRIQQKMHGGATIARSTSDHVDGNVSDEESGIAMVDLSSIDLENQISFVHEEESGFHVSSTKQHLADLEDDIKYATDHLALVIDGETLKYVLNDNELRVLFLRVGRACKSVIACRVSPAQKAEIVSLFRNGIKSKPITLAIGDGANDVVMLQQAHLGIGILGREGRQAVNASDFAIGQFKFLQKLLLVHGRWNYRRMSNVILLCFYKNIVLVLALFFFSFWTLMSGSSLFDTWLYSGYNWFTGLPPVLIGAFDKDMSAEFLLSSPQLYVSAREGKYLNTQKIVQWISRAILHALILGLFPVAVGQFIGLTTELSSFLSFGTMMFGAIITTVLLVMGLETKTFNITHWICYPLSIAFFMTGALVLSAVSVYPSFQGVSQVTFSQAGYYAIAVVFLPLTCYSMELLFKYTRLQLSPTIVDIGCEVDNGKSEIRKDQFKDLVDVVFYEKKVNTRDLEDVLQSTLTEKANKTQTGPSVARQASSTVLLPE